MNRLLLRQRACGQRGRAGIAEPQHCCHRLHSTPAHNRAAVRKQLEPRGAAPLAAAQQLWRRLLPAQRRQRAVLGGEAGWQGVQGARVRAARVAEVAEQQPVAVKESAGHGLDGITVALASEV